MFFLPRMRVPFSWSLRPGQLWGVWGVWRGRNWHSETCGYLSVTKGVRSIISQRWPLKQQNGLGYLFIQNILNAFFCFKEEDMKQFECSEFFLVIKCNLYHCKTWSWWICKYMYCMICISMLVWNKLEQIASADTVESSLVVGDQCLWLSWVTL